jgi:hypothetical protein
MAEMLYNNKHNNINNVDFEGFNPIQSPSVLNCLQCLTKKKYLWAEGTSSSIAFLSMSYI